MTTPVFERRIAVGPEEGRARKRPWARGERKRHVVSILYRTTVGYALHNGVPVPAASSFDAAPRPISCLCMSGRGPHPPARRNARGCHTAPSCHPPGSSCPGSSRVSPRAHSCRSSLRRDGEAAARPEHIHRNVTPASRCKSNLPSVSASSPASSSFSCYLEYVISGTEGLEEAATSWWLARLLL